MLLSQSRNKIINGNFDVWQRGTALASGTGDRFLADRWLNSSIGSTYTASRQTTTLTEPFLASAFQRLVVTSVANAANFANIQHRIESVITGAGKTLTLSFWAKADANKPASVEFIQYFGTGGSPSASVLGLGVTKINLTSSWQKFTVSVALPSIVGKTIGTAGNDFLGLALWCDAGSNFNSRTSNLGQQSGTFDLASVMIVEGESSGDFELAGGSLAGELFLSQRYFEKSYDLAVAPGSNITVGTYVQGQFISGQGGQIIAGNLNCRVAKRAIPTWTYYDRLGNSNRVTQNQSGLAVDNTLLSGFNPFQNGAIALINAAPTTYGMFMAWTAEAEL